MALAPPPTQIPIADKQGQAPEIWRGWFRDLYQRLGAAAAATSVTGPATSSDNAVVRWDGTGGGTLQNSGVLIADGGNITMPGGATVDGREISTDGTALDTVVAAEAAHEADTSNPHAVAVGQVIGAIKAFQAAVGQAALASGGEVIVLNAAAGETWKVRGALLSGAGTNFSGGGGDRLLSITDNTSIWSLIPAATLQSLAAARWGDTGLPFPATAAHLTTASASGTDIVAKYSGGATDYTAGSLTLVILAERTA